MAASNRRPTLAENRAAKAERIVEYLLLWVRLLGLQDRVGGVDLAELVYRWTDNDWKTVTDAMQEPRPASHETVDVVLAMLRAGAPKQEEYDDGIPF